VLVVASTILWLVWQNFLHKPPKLVAPTIFMLDTKFCHAHSNAHKALKLVAPTIFMLEQNVN